MAMSTLVDQQRDRHALPPSIAARAARRSARIGDHGTVQRRISVTTRPPRLAVDEVLRGASISRSPEADVGTTRAFGVTDVEHAEVAEWLEVVETVNGGDRPRKRTLRQVSATVKELGRNVKRRISSLWRKDSGYVSISDGIKDKEVTSQDGSIPRLHRCWANDPAAPRRGTRGLFRRRRRVRPTSRPYSSANLHIQNDADGGIECYTPPPAYSALSPATSAAHTSATAAEDVSPGTGALHVEYHLYAAHDAGTAPESPTSFGEFAEPIMISDLLNILAAIQQKQEKGEFDPAALDTRFGRCPGNRTTRAEQVRASLSNLAEIDREMVQRNREYRRLQELEALHEDPSDRFRGRKIARPGEIVSLLGGATSEDDSDALMVAIANWDSNTPFPDPL